jgi:uncharacterized Zn finger protein (UPF0148 family)
MIEQHDRFYELVRGKDKIKKRPCLRCRTPFRSLHRGHRVCSTCKRRVSAHAFDDARDLMGTNTALDALRNSLDN